MADPASVFTPAEIAPALTDIAELDFSTQLAAAITLPEPPFPPGAWMELFRVRRLMWSAYTITIPHLPPALAGLRILHLTDLHVDRHWMPAWDRLHELVRQSPPDLILITGDFVETKYDSRYAVPTLRRLLDPLSARLGAWGILGNHDGDVLAHSLGDAPLRLLANEVITLESAGAVLQIMGVHGISRLDLPRRLRGELAAKPPGAVRLVMAHYPDMIRPLATLGADVFFAGHTHGGQACLPGGRPLMTHDSLPPRFCRGVHRIGPTWLVVGRGLAFSTYPIRSFCPAEVIEITLAAG